MKLSPPKTKYNSILLNNSKFTCRIPILLSSHIFLKFQKNGELHFWQVSLSAHSGVWKKQHPDCRKT